MFTCFCSIHVITFLWILTMVHQEVVLRCFAAILLRRVIDPFGVHWPRLDSTLTTVVRSQLLAVWANENEAVILRKVGSFHPSRFKGLALIPCNTQLAHAISTNSSSGDWKEVIPFILQHQSAKSGHNCVTALFLLETLSEYNSDVST